MIQQSINQLIGQMATVARLAPDFDEKKELYQSERKEEKLAQLAEQSKLGAKSLFEEGNKKPEDVARGLENMSDIYGQNEALLRRRMELSPSAETYKKMVDFQTKRENTLASAEKFRDTEFQKQLEAMNRVKSKADAAIKQDDEFKKTKSMIYKQVAPNAEYFKGGL